jgi:hypothetical protein
MHALMHTGSLGLYNVFYHNHCERPPTRSQKYTGTHAPLFSLILSGGFS